MYRHSPLDDFCLFGLLTLLKHVFKGHQSMLGEFINRTNEVVINNATLECSKGSHTCKYEVPEGTKKIEGETIAIRTDVGKCIGKFGICDILTKKA